MSLAPKTFDLLLLLLESDGRVLSKKELMTALWPDTFVEEANLSFQMSALRKALGEEGSVWIETVPKIGYRLARPVTPAVPTASRRFNLQAAAAAAAVAVILAVAYWVWKQRQPVAPSAAAMTAVPLTAYGGAGNPTLSPDGSQVAFAWNGPKQDNTDIYVKLVGPGEPVRLTHDPAVDHRPVWSPDGRQIAFLRRTGGMAASLFLIPALGGAERKIGDLQELSRVTISKSTLGWAPDGKWLALSAKFREDEIPGIWLLSVENGERRRLTSAPPGDVGDFGPSFSPDGRRLSFVRVPRWGVTDIYVLPLTTGLAPEGPSRRVTFENRAIEAPAWTPDGRELVFSVGGHVAPRVLKRIAVDPPAGRKSDPQPLPFGEQATTLSISRSGRLVYTREVRDSNIWRVELALSSAPSSASANQPVRVVASTYDDYLPHYSPDGSRIVFNSTRSGSEEIWVAQADGSHPVQLTSMGGPTTANPRWSPDGRTILFYSRRTGNADLYLFHLDSGSIQQLTNDSFQEFEASWSSDGRWIYFNSRKTGRGEVWKMPAGGGPALQVTRSGGTTPFESRDGKWVYYAKNGASPTSIWRVPPSGGEETQVVADVALSLNFAVGERGIYFMPFSENSISFFEFATGKTAPVLKLGKPGWPGMAISPDQRFLLYSVIDHAGSDLMLVENFR